jgi:hypothetical protein
MNTHPTARLYFRISPESLARLDSLWRRRSRPCPDTPAEECPFKSRQEYLSFVISNLNRASPIEWYIFEHWLKKL